MTWQVEQAHTPPQAWSRPILKPSEMSRMLPGRPLCPYGTFAGSTSTVLPLGRNVTLYFFVAGLYFTSSMYGLLPPMVSPLEFGYLAPFERRRNGAIHHQLRQVLGRFIQLVDPLADRAVVPAFHR